MVLGDTHEAVKLVVGNQVGIHDNRAQHDMHLSSAAPPKLPHDELESCRADDVGLA